MLQRIWDYKRECWTDEDVLADGEMLRVPLMLCDGAQRDVRDHFARDHFVRDALARHNATGFHRPNFIQESFVHAAQPTVTADAVSDDLEQRRGIGLRDAMVKRDRALAATERRQQWRAHDFLEQIGSGEYGRRGDHEYDDPEDDESNGELAGSAEYPGGDYAGNDDDDDDAEQHGSGEYGHSGGAPDASGLRAAQDDRERARLERDQIGNNKWRNGSAVSRANANERQLERWRGNGTR
jgi:hypothetical protein